MPNPERPARRSRGSLTREQVVEAALRLADSEGLDALSMPALARSLGCGVMTLYGYIASKEDLLDAIALRGLADLRLEQPLPANPAAILAAWGRALRQTLLEHPSLPVIFLSRTVLGPGIFRGVEALLAALGRAGAERGAAVHAIYATLTYAVGFAAWEAPRTRLQPEAAYAAAWRRAYAELDPAAFPRAGAALEDLARVAGEEQFERGLVALAAGLAASLTSG